VGCVFYSSMLHFFLHLDRQ